MLAIVAFGGCGMRDRRGGCAVGIAMSAMTDSVISPEFIKLE